MNLPSLLPANLIPPNLSAFIAGGYAACPELAADCDVWVTAPQSMTLGDARAALLDHLTQCGFAFTPEEETRTTEAGDPSYDLVYVTIRKVAMIPMVLAGRDCPIHLLVTDSGMDDVLEGFDISTHQCAITAHSEGHLYTGPEWTPLTEEPYVIKWTEPTRARLDKIRARYAHLRKESNETVL